MAGGWGVAVMLVLLKDELVLLVKRVLQKDNALFLVEEVEVGDDASVRVVEICQLLQSLSWYKTVPCSLSRWY